jgi:hypothetical protein
MILKTAVAFLTARNAKKKKDVVVKKSSPFG